MDRSQEDIKVEIEQLLQAKEIDYSRFATLSNELVKQDRNHVRFSVDAGIINRLGKDLNLYLAHEGTYLKKWMKDTLKDLQPEKSLSEIVRMVFGAEIDAAKLKNRPLSKLKKDLLEQFHIIDENGNVHPKLMSGF